jgi:hypothetical protein
MSAIGAMLDVMPWFVFGVVASVSRHINPPGNTRSRPFLAGFFGLLMGVLVLLIIWPIFKGRSGAQLAGSKSTHSLTVPESPLRQAPSLTIPKLPDTH